MLSIPLIKDTTIPVNSWFLLTLLPFSEVQTCTNSSIFTAVDLSVRILFKTAVLSFYLSNSVLFLNILILSLNNLLDKLTKWLKIEIKSIGVNITKSLLEYTLPRN